MWEVTPLIDLCDDIYAGGDAPPKENISKFKTDEYNVPIYSNGAKNSGLYGYTSFEPRTLKPAITISARGTIGHIELRNEPFLPIVRLIVLVPKISKVYLTFLKYALLNKGVFSLGSSIPQLTVPMLKKMSIGLPPLAEQKRIVAKLDAVFAEIDRAIEAVENKIAEIPLLYENAIIVELENIDSCVEQKLSDVCEKITDGTHFTPKYFDEGYIFLSSKNVKSRKIDWENVRYIDEAQHIQMHKRIAPRVGDVLLAKNGTTAVAAIVDRDVVFDIYVSLAWLRSKGDVLPEYLLEYVNSKMAREQFNARTKGSGVPNLHLQEIREVVIRFPEDKEEQKLVVRKLKNIDDACDSYKQINEKKLQSLVSLKSAILKQELQSEAA